MFLSLSYCFVKKTLNWCIGYVMDGWFSEWISERCIYVRLDQLLNTNQMSCCKGKWYVRRFGPNVVENGPIYSSVKEEEVFI